MKKIGKQKSSVIVFLVVALLIVSFVNFTFAQEIYSSGSNNFKKLTFFESDSVYVKGDPQQCNGQFESVDLYVVDSVVGSPTDQII